MLNLYLKTNSIKNKKNNIVVIIVSIIVLLSYYRYLYSYNTFKNFLKEKKNTRDTSIISLEDLYAMDLEYLTDGIELDFRIFIAIKTHSVLYLDTIKFFKNICNNFFYIKLLTMKNYNLEFFFLNSIEKLWFNNEPNSYCLVDTSSIFMTNDNIIDHIRYFNIELKNYSILDSLKFYDLLRHRYGIGKHISKLILNYLGISYNINTNLLPINNFYSNLSTFFSSRLWKLDNYLLNFYISRHSFIKKIKIYRGFRLLKGYPSKGQRTRSNYKTSIRKPYYYSFYFI